MRAHITKRADGAGLPRCVRDDGSIVWQKQNERHAVHFALQDLTHFAEETTLGCRNGSLGLVAQGQLPPEAVAVEKIVGLLDVERAVGVIWTCEEFSQFTGMRPLTQQEIVRIKALRRELFGRWFALEIGQTLEFA